MPYVILPLIAADVSMLDADAATFRRLLLLLSPLMPP